MRMRFETNPGKSFASAGVLPRSRASSTIAAAVSSDVCTARITSTSPSTGTGLKKCIPITARAAVAAASDVIGIEDVFDASTAPAGRRRRPRGRSRFSRPRPRRLPLSAGRRARARRPEPRGQASRRRRASLLGELRETLPHRAECPLDRSRELVVERDATAGCSDHLGDAAAHLARPRPPARARIARAESRGSGAPGRLGRAPLRSRNSAHRRTSPRTKMPMTTLTATAARLAARRDEEPRLDDTAGRRQPAVVRPAHEQEADGLVERNVDVAVRSGRAADVEHARPGRP